MPSSANTAVIREMQRDDYAVVRALWERTENIGLNESDEEPAIESVLTRNAGLSAVAMNAEGRIVGALLCGHDGRRGYLHHLAVAPDYRGNGLGRQLVEFALAGLQRAGIPKCNLFVLGDSHDAHTYWEHHGWRLPRWIVLQKRILACGSKDGGTC